MQELEGGHVNPGALFLDAGAFDRMVTSGELESYKVGRLRRFDRSALEAYLDRRRKIAAEEREHRTQSERDT